MFAGLLKARVTGECPFLVEWQFALAKRCIPSLPFSLRIASFPCLVSFSLLTKMRAASYQWMTTNLKKASSTDVGNSSGEGFSWTFHLDGVSDMYRSYEDTNMWWVVTGPRTAVRGGLIECALRTHSCCYTIQCVAAALVHVL